MKRMKIDDLKATLNTFHSQGAAKALGGAEVSERERGRLDMALAVLNALDGDLAGLTDAVRLNPAGRATSPL